MKEHFKRTDRALISLICIFLESVLKNFKTTESEIADCIKRFLKYALDRKGGERKHAKPKTD